MDSETFLFRKCLYQISSHLGRYDVDKIKFMVGDSIPRALLEAAHSGFDVFCLMEERGLLSRTDVSFLKDVLDTVSKSHYVERYQSLGGSAGGLLKQVPRPVEGAPRQGGGTNLSSHKRLLGKLGDEMSPDNVHDMALFFHGEPTTFQVRDIERLKTAEKIFEKLESGRHIQPGDYTILYNVLDVLGRRDLCELISEECRSLPTSPQKDTASPHGPIPVQDNTASLHKPIPVQDETGTKLSRPIAAEGDRSIPYPHQPPSHLSSMDTTSAPSTNSSLESRDDANQQHCYVGGKLVVSPSMGPHPLASENTQIQELERDKQKLQEQLAVAMNVTKVTHDRKVQLLEDQLQQKITEVEELRQQTSQLTSVPRPPSYPMDKSPHGIALVIVNEKYDKNSKCPDLELPQRQGAKHDLRLFKDTFSALNYNVVSHTNLTAMEMLRVIHAVTSDDHTNHDSFVLCVSTHGVAQGVYGSDSVIVNWQEIDAHIKQSPTLQGKPKLCFFQSCRKPHTVTADGSGYPTQGHADSDFLKVFASTPNNEAYISPQYGSWLASSLHRNFTAPRLMYTSNLETLMNYVCEEVCRQVGELVEGEGKVYVQQCVHRETTLNKAVYFFPPNHS